MLSSRCSDKVTFEGKQQAFAKLRLRIKNELESLRRGEHQVFEVWIHEDESYANDQTSWDICMAMARKADLFLALYNGRAGWSGTSSRIGDNVGICHAEFHEAFYHCPSKIRTVQFSPAKAKKNSADEKFQKYFDNQSVFGAQVNTGEEAIEASVRAAVTGLLDLARSGVAIDAKGNYFVGEALNWSRMDFQTRRETTRRVIFDYLRQQPGSTDISGVDYFVSMKIAGKKVAIVCDCVPATFSTPSARELVGQPFLRDYLKVERMAKTVYGPVHLIGCHKGVTEAQAIKQLGFPDAIVVSAPFGIYVADEIQKIQMVFIANCRDETSTRQGVQRMLRWLSEQSEDKLLASRAASRRKIVDCISNQQSK